MYYPIKCLGFSEKLFKLCNLQMYNKLFLHDAALNMNFCLLFLEKVLLTSALSSLFWDLTFMYCLSVILCTFCDCSKWTCSKIQGKNRTKEKQDASRFSGKFSIVNSVNWNLKHVALTFGFVVKLSYIYLIDVMFSALLLKQS